MIKYIPVGVGAGCLLGTLAVRGIVFAVRGVTAPYVAAGVCVTASGSRTT